MIGDLDRRIGIYTQTETANSFGEKTTVDTLSVTVWAAIIPSGGKETFEAKKLTATNEVIFQIRHRTVTEKNKIYYNSTWYNILKIEEVDRKRYLNILAEKKI
jgi:SPP1 family predicted phage head-tail adaptor